MDLNERLKPDIVAEATHIPFNNDAFDDVMCMEVLEHLPEPENAIKEIKRILKEDGLLYVTVPMSWCLHYEPNDFYRFTKYGLKYLLEKNGFQLLSLDRIGGVFSLIGVRLVDVLFTSFVRGTHVLPLKVRDVIGMGFTIPLSVFFYLLGLALDGINKSDAIGWAVLAKNKKK